MSVLSIPTIFDAGSRGAPEANLLPVLEYTLRPQPQLGGYSFQETSEGVRHDHQRELLNKLSQEIQKLLDSQGLKGRYLLDAGFTTDDARGAMQPQIKLYVNSSEVLRVVREANYNRQICAHVMESSNQCEQVIHNQIWEASRDALSVIELRISTPEYQAEYAEALALPSSTPADRLARGERANQARVAAVQSIRKYLDDEGLSRSFCIPASQWGGTLDGLRIIGTAAVRAKLEISSAEK